MKIIKNFDKQDCVHYKLQPIRGCCGKSPKNAGFCTIPDPDGNHSSKICSIQTHYCRYEKKEADNVHPEKL